MSDLPNEPGNYIRLNRGEWIRYEGDHFDVLADHPPSVALEYQLSVVDPPMRSFWEFTDPPPVDPDAPPCEQWPPPYKCACPKHLRIIGQSEWFPVEERQYSGHYGMCSIGGDPADCPRCRDRYNTETPRHSRE